MVTNFQINDGWLYILFDDGVLARKFLKQPGLEWENVELPTKLVEPKQSNAGIKNTTFYIRDTK